MAIMRYMGDQSLAKNQTEVDCVYTVLVVSQMTCQSSCQHFFFQSNRTATDIPN